MTSKVGQQNGETDLPENSAPVSKTAGLRNPHRRRLGIAGLGASGVLIYLACKLVLSGVVSTSASGFLSAKPEHA